MEDDGTVLFIELVLPLVNFSLLMTYMHLSHINKKTTYTDPRLAFAVEEKENPDDFRQLFDSSSTSLQVLHGRDLSGKVAIVTGGNSGIGFETCRAMAFHGAHVVMACRDMDHARLQIARISEERVCFCKATLSDDC